MAANSVDSDQYVNGSIDVEHLADNSIDEASLYADNSPTNDYALTAKSSATGGLTWAAVTDTNTMGSGFTVSATTDSNATTITQGDDLMFTAGTGITCETTADGTVTITNTVSAGDSNAGGANGSAGSPTFSFASDTDTGMYRTGANGLGLSTGGTVRADIDTNGNTNIYENINLAATKKLYLDGGDNTYIQENSADEIHIVAGGSERLTVTASSVVVNQTDDDVNFRVESVDNANQILVDAGNNTTCIDGDTRNYFYSGGGNSNYVAHDWIILKPKQSGSTHKAVMLDYDVIGTDADVITSPYKGLITSSDIREKNDIGGIDNGLSIVNKLNPRYFSWKEDEKNTQQLGFYSQEVHEHLPEGAPKTLKVDCDGNPYPGAVDEDGNIDYTWGLSIRALVAVLTKAVQELSAKVEALENE